MRWSLTCCFWLFLIGGLRAAELPRGVRQLDFFGYTDCFALENEVTRVVLCHQSGGRVLEYSHRGVNAIALDERGEGWLPGNPNRQGAGTGGRFDIGPEQVVPKRPLLWEGAWTAAATGPWTVLLTSQPDASTGVQLMRQFVLDPATSRLNVTQTIHNITAKSVEYCHWSRTFGVWGGVAVLPLTRPSRFPQSYVQYQPDKAIQLRPVDPHIVERDDCLVIDATPAQPKLGFDSMAGWLAYAEPNHLLFVKQFPTNPDRVYNEVAGLTVSIWYPNEAVNAVELEPIGPRERLAPGESAAFTETWTLLPFIFPGSGAAVDVPAVRKLVEQLPAIP